MCREEGTYCVAIIKQYHRDTDTTYVYESTSYWDAEKGQSRSKRRVIGKIDPGTGEIVPTGKRGRSKKTQPDQMKEAVLSGFESPADEADRGQILQLELSVSSLKARISELEEENRKYRQALEKAASLASQINAACQPFQSK